MAFDIPIDLDYFEHPKTLELISILKIPEADIYPLRLWKWAAKYARDGILPANVAMIEREIRWQGPSGALHKALIKAGFLEKDGKTIHDWHEHVGRAIMLYEAKKRKQREKYDKSAGILPEECGKNSGSIPPTLETLDTLPNSTQERIGNGAAAPIPPRPKRAVNPKDEQTRLIFQRAEKLHLRNNPSTVERWIAAHVYGGRAAKLNDLFFSDQCQGMSTIEIDERWFNHKDLNFKEERDRNGPPKI
jgi:hypothetical protein